MFAENGLFRVLSRPGAPSADSHGNNLLKTKALCCGTVLNCKRTMSRTFYFSAGPRKQIRASQQEKKKGPKWRRRRRRTQTLQEQGLSLTTISLLGLFSEMPRFPWLPQFQPGRWDNSRVWLLCLRALLLTKEHTAPSPKYCPVTGRVKETLLTCPAVDAHVNMGKLY